MARPSSRKSRRIWSAALAFALGCVLSAAPLALPVSAQQAPAPQTASAEVDELPPSALSDPAGASAREGLLPADEPDELPPSALSDPAGAAAREAAARAAASSSSDAATQALRSLGSSSSDTAPAPAPVGTASSSSSPAPAVSASGSSASPSAPAPAASSSDAKAERPKIFGTVAFRMSPKKQKNWLSVIDRNGKSPIFSAQRQLSRTTTWAQLRDRVKGLPRIEMLREVNRFWNAWPYRSDLEVWKQEDYWAIPAEFLKRSGDCEDYSIAKYYTLRELGVPADDLRIVVVKETIRNIGHAILVVFDGSEAYILDNLSNSVRPMARVRNYQPHFSVNEEGRWMHVKAKTPGKKAAGPGGKKHGKKKAR